jgi:hypothetical protein
MSEKITAPEGVETLKHTLPIYAQDRKFVCMKCEFKTGNFDQMIQHFKINHLQAFIKKIVDIDDKIKLIRESVQYTPKRDLVL